MHQEDHLLLLDQLVAEEAEAARENEGPEIALVDDREARLAEVGSTRRRAIAPAT
jgi:hypothetical protein